MSLVIKCDGCGITARGSDRPKSWFRADIRSGDGTTVIAGDFCSVNCLAVHISVDPLHREWKKLPK